ncbi:hypothetical protein BJY52DRAFT_1385178 [Lactarius psammicola]|nr:hypothetical protein BJY52DRAFT_1385178 [Lactarius psammicola]
MIQDMKEMAALIPEVLASDVSTHEPRLAILVFTEAVNMTEMFRQNHTQQVADGVVQMLREATVLKLGSQISLALASCLATRFQTTHVINDYGLAMTIADKIGWLIIDLMTSRLNSYANPEYLEDSIPSHRLPALLRVPSLPDYHHTTIAKALNVYLEQRSSYFSVTASENSLKIPPKKSKGGYAFSLPSSKSSRQWDGGSAVRNDKRTDVEVAVERARTLFPPPLPHASLWFSWLPAMEFAQILSEAYIRTKRPDYVSEAITAYLDLRRFTSPLDADWLRRRQDFKEAMQLAPMIANDGSAEASIRFEIAWWWANWAWGQAHPSISTAYEHFRLIKVLGELGGLQSDYASYQIEWIDKSRRSRLQSEEEHYSADPASADQFAAINRNLESVTMSVAQNESGEIDDGETGTRRCEETDSIGHLLAVQRTLLEKRNSFISHIRSFPGFENFLGSPSFDALNSAAAHGSIVIINQSIWRSDIVILLGDLPPSGLDSEDYAPTLVSVLADLYELVKKPVIERLHQLNVPDNSRVWWCPTSTFCSFPLHAMSPVPSDDSNKVHFVDLYIPSYTPTLSALIEPHKPGSQPETFDEPSLLLVA